MRLRHTPKPTLPDVAPAEQRSHDVKLAIEYVPINQLKPAERNARRHTPVQIAQIQTSIKAFGMLAPIIVDKHGRIIAGHGRWMALKNLDYKHAPTIRVEHLSKEQKRLYALADNKISDNAGWDEGLLRIEITELLAIDIDLSIAGFDGAEADRLLMPTEFSVDDGEPDNPAPPLAPVTRTGDLWLLGSHRLICADATQHAAYASLMGDQRAHACFTDPPYNVPTAGHITVANKADHKDFIMASGEMTAEQYAAFLTAPLLLIFEFSRDGSLHFVCQDWRSTDAMMAASRNAKFELKNLIVWDKTNAGMGSLYRSRHELIFLLKKGKARHTNNIKLGRYGRNRSNVWAYPGANGFGKGRDKALADHPTVKPLAMVVDALLDVTNQNDIVLDPFAGSGTTLLAAERAGRRCRAIEIEPRFVDVIIQRWQRMTGQTATLNGATLSFAEVSEQRRKEAKAS